jgi:6-phosphogluconolactonase
LKEVKDSMNCKIFIGTYSKNNGVVYGDFNDETGKISFQGTIDVENPSYLQVTKNRLYGVSEVQTFKGLNGGALFSADLKTNQVTRILPTHGKDPAHLVMDEDTIYAANYTEGSLSIFKTDEHGDLLPSDQNINHFGKGANPSRQASAHIHFAEVDPLKRFLAVCDLGMDKVFLYPRVEFQYTDCVKSAISTNATVISCPPGSGPRHLTFSADGKRMYILTELSSQLLVYDISGANINLIQKLSTLPTGFTGVNTAAAIHFSPNGKQLAVSNRGHNSIAFYHIDAEGKLTGTSRIATGKSPRDFNYSPSGRWLLVANADDSTIATYEIKNNEFKMAGLNKINQPVCIKFL